MALASLPLSEVTRTERGARSVQRVVNLLRVNRRYHVKSHLPYKSPYDILCNGKRVEVKTAELTLEGCWRVNIHRHNVLNETEVDVYIFELLADFLPEPIMLLFRAPLEAKTVMFFPSSMLKGKYAEHVDAYHLLEPVQKNPTLPELRRTA